MERILESCSLNRPVAELVLGGVYSDQGELVPLFQQIERLRRFSSSVLFHNSLNRGLTYVHVDDVADAFCHAMTPRPIACTPSSHREASAVTYRNP